MNDYPPSYRVVKLSKVVMKMSGLCKSVMKLEGKLVHSYQDMGAMPNN